jgi:hypothetical protein
MFMEIKKLFEESYLTGREVQTKEHKGEIIDGRQVWQKLEEKTGNLKNQNLLNNDEENLKYN